MIIDYKALSKEALLGLVEEFITREGSEYGERSYTLEEKTAQVMALLVEQKAFIVFDDQQESVTIVSADQMA